MSRESFVAQGELSGFHKPASSRIFGLFSQDLEDARSWGPAQRGRPKIVRASCPNRKGSLSVALGSRELPSHHPTIVGRTRVRSCRGEARHDGGDFLDFTLVALRILSEHVVP
jgi:hypothetical protein